MRYDALGSSSAFPTLKYPHHAPHLYLPLLSRFLDVAKQASNDILDLNGSCLQLGNNPVGSKYCFSNLLRITYDAVRQYRGYVGYSLKLRFEEREGA